MIDPIADMLTRIRNASAVKKEEVVLPMSKIKLNIAKILETNGWIIKAEVLKADAEAGEKFDRLKMILKYDSDNQPAITSLKRVSKPGLRVYKAKTELPRVLNNMGMAIISTSQGLMTGKEAKKKGVGGEIICEIY